ncbi:MAG: radical SAM protein [Thermodesulfobacteriota bacterium]|jgi:hypothetical protein|nr:MAG: radical SAM protein [Thermodesulfobacteriota bacterium]
MEKFKAEDLIMEEGPMGPIGEGESLILRVNRNCPWNRCSFCNVYKGKMYSARDVGDIKRDIDVVRRLRDLIEMNSGKMGLHNCTSRENLRQIVRDCLVLEGNEGSGVAPQWAAFRSLQNVANWFRYGGKKVFLQDANALGLKAGSLTEVLLYLKDIFPDIQTISTYARSVTSGRRSSQELEDLRKAGLSWCYVGIESGCDEVLKFMNKGVTAEEHVRGGLKLKEAGIRMAAFVMPGLAGAKSELSRKHMEDTVTVLNKIQPDEVRVRSLAVVEGAPLYEMWRQGEFQSCSEDQLLEEIKLLFEGLEFDCTIETLQMTNPLFTVKGPLSRIKGGILDIIDKFQSLSRAERAKIFLEHYTEGGYLEVVRGWGKCDSALESLFKEAIRAIYEGSPKAMEMTDLAISALKSKGVP